MGFGVSDADLHATIEELRELPDEEFDELFEEETDQLSDGHLVEYAEECVRHTEAVEKKRLKLDETLWSGHENEMPEMALKDDATRLR